MRMVGGSSASYSCGSGSVRRLERMQRGRRSLERKRAAEEAERAHPRLVACGWRRHEEAPRAVVHARLAIEECDS